MPRPKSNKSSSAQKITVSSSRPEKEIPKNKSATENKAGNNNGVSKGVTAGKIKVVQINSKRILTGAKASVPNKLLKTSTATSISKSINIASLSLATDNKPPKYSKSDVHIQQPIKTSDSQASTSSSVKNTTTTDTNVVTPVTFKKSFQIAKQSSVPPKKTSNFSVLSLTDCSGHSNNTSSVKVIRKGTAIISGSNGKVITPTIMAASQTLSKKKVTVEKEPMSSSSSITSSSTSISNVLSFPQSKVKFNIKPCTPMILSHTPTNTVRISSIEKITSNSDTASFSKSDSILKQEHSPVKYTILADNNSSKSTGVYNMTSTSQRVTVNSNYNIDTVAPLGGDDVNIQDAPVDYSTLSSSKYEDKISVKQEPLFIPSLLDISSKTANIEPIKTFTAATEHETIPVTKDNNEFGHKGLLEIKIGNYQTEVDLNADNESRKSDPGNTSSADSLINTNGIAKLPSIESAFSKVADCFKYPEEASQTFTALK